MAKSGTKDAAASLQKDLGQSGVAGVTKETSSKLTFSAAVQGVEAVAPGSPVREDVQADVGISPDQRARIERHKVAAVENQAKKQCREADVAKKAGEDRVVAAQEQQREVERRASEAEAKLKEAQARHAAVEKAGEQAVRVSNDLQRVAASLEGGRGAANNNGGGNGGSAGSGGGGGGNVGGAGGGEILSR